MGLLVKVTGIILTSASVSTKDLLPIALSGMRRRRLKAQLAIVVATAIWLTHFRTRKTTQTNTLPSFIATHSMVPTDVVVIFACSCGFLVLSPLKTRYGPSKYEIGNY